MKTRKPAQLLPRARWSVSCSTLRLDAAPLAFRQIRYRHTSCHSAKNFHRREHRNRLHDPGATGGAKSSARRGRRSCRSGWCMPTGPRGGHFEGELFQERRYPVERSGTSLCCFSQPASEPVPRGVRPTCRGAFPSPPAWSLESSEPGRLQSSSRGVPFSFGRRQDGNISEALR